MLSSREETRINWVLMCSRYPLFWIANTKKRIRFPRLAHQLSAVRGRWSNPHWHRSGFMLACDPV
jgi:hypothetical protein